MKPIVLFLAFLFIGWRVDALSVTAVAVHPTVCAGNYDTINVSASGGASPYTFTISPSGTFAGSYFVVTPSVTTTYTVQVMDNIGAIATNTVTVNCYPHDTMWTTGSNALICSGACTQLTFNGTPNATISYSVVPGTISNITLNGSGTAVATVCPTYTSIYMPIWITNPVTNCLSYNATLYDTVYVNPTPTASMTVTNNNLCSGNCATLTFTGTPACTVTYSTSTTPGVQTVNLPFGVGVAQVTICPTVTTTYTLMSIINPATGCSNTLNTTTTVSVTPTPTVTLTPVGPTTICSNTCVTLTANGTPSGHYGWLQNGAPLPVFNSSTYCAAASGTYQVIDTVGLCYTTSNTSVVQVNPVPTASISTYSQICIGGCTVLTITATPNCTLTYSAYPGGTNTINTGGSGIYTLTVCPTVNTTYSLQTITNPATGCINNTLAGVSVVNVNAIPTATIVPTGNVTVCAGQPLVANTNFGVMFQWYLNGTGAGNALAGATGPSYVPQIAGTYYVNVATGFVCNTFSGPTVVNLMPSPTVTTTPNIMACTNSPLLINCTINPAGLGCVWTGPNGFTSTALNNTLTNITPAMAGVYSVSVTGGNGCTTVATSSVAVNQPPSAAITPTGTVTACAGSCAALNVPASANYNYQWYNTAGMIIAGTSSSYCAAASGSYYAVVTNVVTGCSATSQQVQVVINPLPTASISPNAATVCMGSCAAFTVTGTPNSSLAYTIPPGQTILTTIPASGVYNLVVCPTVTGTVSLVSVSSPATGCVNSNLNSSATVTVNPVPSATLTPTGNVTMCSGQVLTGNTNLMGLNYQWYLNGLPLVNAQYMTYAPTTSGSYTLWVSSGNGAGCVYTTPATIVTLNTTPTVTATNTGPVCEGNTLLVNSSPTPAGAAIVWVGPNGFTSTSGNNTISNATIWATGTYSVIATLNGCSDTTTTNAVVNATPVPMIIPPFAQTCTGTCAALLADAGNAQYQWMLGGTAISGATDGSYCAPTAGGYTVMVTDNVTGCSATSDSAIVMVNALPVVSASITMSGCDGGVDGLLADGAATYNWLPATGLDCNNCMNPVASPSATTTYTVTGTDGNGCSDTASITVNENMIWGNVYFNNVTPDTTDVKVWLITYDPNTNLLTAVDSTVSCQQNGIPYYEFDNEPPLQYMTKAKLLYGNNPGSSGYIPTYYSNTLYWSTASHVTHTNTNDGTNDITMQYGTVPAGPGFIGGNVLSGANKHTTGSAPVDGMMVYLKDNNGSIISYTYTDGNGNYSFSNIANGTYEIYPEEMNYLTTPWPEIVVDNIEWAAINFKKNTTEMTITPYLQNDGVKNVNAQTLEIYPNPVDADIYLTAGTTDGNCHLAICDMSGKEIWKGDVNLSNGKGKAHIGDIPSGVYMATVMVNGVRYVGKVVK